jgi:hypothetical protein
VVVTTALLASSAMAQDIPPAAPADSTPTLTQPAVTTVDPSDLPTQVPALPVSPPADSPVLPDPSAAVKHLLVKQVRAKIVLYQQSAWHWQKLMGRRLSSGGNIWALGNLDTANASLAAWQLRSHQLHQTARKWMAQRIDFFTQQIAHMNRVMGARNERVLLGSGSLELKFSKARSAWSAVLNRFNHPPYESQFGCIHHYEGSWTDGGAPYWGGLQMDLSFMDHYGGYLLRTKGTADRWTPLEQIWVAVRAVNSGRGFYPWPNTARYCGIL